MHDEDELKAEVVQERRADVLVVQKPQSGEPTRTWNVHVQLPLVLLRHLLFPLSSGGGEGAQLCVQSLQARSFGGCVHAVRAFLGSEGTLSFGAS